MEEIWKDIKGYKGLYQASSLGRFKNLRSGKILCPTFSDYIETWNLGLRNRKGIWKIHIPYRIIAELFIANPNKLRAVIARGDKKNLNPNNWFWASWSDIMKEAQKSRTHIVREFICRNKDCKKVFIMERSNRKPKYCSKKCADLSYHMSRKGKKSMIESKKKKVVAIKDDEKIIFNSIIEAGDYIGRSPNSISNACAGRIKCCGGYKFKFK